VLEVHFQFLDHLACDRCPFFALSELEVGIGFVFVGLAVL
jgi:hypothetical protein